MNILYKTYSILTNGLFMWFFLPLRFYAFLNDKSNISIKERFGLFPFKTKLAFSGLPRIWFHAVSLGEIHGAASIIKAVQKIVPKCAIVLSTTTNHGHNLACRLFKDEIPVIYAPIDCLIPVRRALSRIRPHIMVFLETEIWPTWLTEAHQMGVQIALVNGRISPRSIKRYKRLKPLFGPILKKINIFSMILFEDAARICAMGAERHRIFVNGNAKYDLLLNSTHPSIEKDMKRIFNLGRSQPVFIAGSTRKGEEILILDAFEKITKQFPNLLLIIAPRHIKRTHEIVGYIKKRGHKYQLRSHFDGSNIKRTENIVIINIFGELSKLYSIGTIIFCGASLVPFGGQNPLEAAAWGKIVFYGPSMENFLDAKKILEKAQAGITISNPDMLAEKAIWFLNHPNALERLGSQARDAIRNNHTAARKHALVIVSLFKKQHQSK